MYGGAGSGKSWAVAQMIVYKMLHSKGRRYLALRKVARTLRHSVFSLLVAVIQAWGLEKAFAINKTDMTIQCLHTGSSLVCMGLDDVEKLKSILATDAWIEEATECSREDFLQVNLRLRGETQWTKQIILSFNPVSHLHWLKKHFFDEEQADTFILKTTYKDNRFIDAAYSQVLEDLANQDSTMHQVYALGEWGILSNLIYSNFCKHQVSTDEWYYDSIYMGLDFGYNNPSAFLCVGYKDGELYIFRELYQSHLTNADLIEALKPLVCQRGVVIADSAEPQRIIEMQQAGLNVVPAHKGQQSVKDGIDFLRRMRLNIGEDCIDTFNEMVSYKYKEDKQGNATDEPLGINDHAMDALRYAVQPLQFGGAVKPIKMEQIGRGGAKVGRIR